MRWPEIEDVIFEENAERLKIVLPVHFNWFLVILFSLSLVVWLVMIVGVLVAMFTQGFGFVLIVILIIWLLLWYWMGRVLWGRWQYFAANREILFVSKENFVVRRPVSIFGTTTVYGMKHVTPFYLSGKHHCPAFDYAYQHVYFGDGLTKDGMKLLIGYLNGRYFPDHDDDDEN